MKPHIVYLLAVITFPAFSQNKTLGVGTAATNPNAALHVESPTNNQGFIMPRLSTVQRNAISLAAADRGLMLYDTDLNKPYYWDGGSWQPAAGLAFPYLANDNSSTASFSITNTGLGYAATFLNSGTGGAAQFSISNAGSSSPVLSLVHTGTGNALTANAPIQATQFIGSTNTSVTTFDASNIGSGSAGYFSITNVANGSPSLSAYTAGTGHALNVQVANASNNFAALNINHSGSGNAITANRPIQATGFIGDGSALTNLPSTGWGLGGNAGTDPATNFIGTTDAQNFILKANNTEAIRILPSGQVGISSTPISAKFDVGTTTTTIGIHSGISTPSAVQNRAIQGFSAGSTAQNIGVYGTGEIDGSNGAIGVYGEAIGTGTSDAFGLYGVTNNFTSTSGTTYGLFASAINGATNWAGFFDQGNVHITNGLSVGSPGTFGTNGQVLISQGPGAAPVWGSAGGGLTLPYNNSSGSASTLFNLNSTGTGGAGRFQISNGSNSSTALEVMNAGTGYGIYAENSGSAGTGLLVLNSDPGNPSPVITASQDGGGFVAQFQSNNPTNSLPAVYVNQSGTGHALALSIGNGGSSADVLSIVNSGSGRAISASGTIEATAFVGDGSGLTNLPPATVGANSITNTEITDGTIGTDDIANNAIGSEDLNANINIVTSGNINATNITAGTFFGNGSGLTNLPSSGWGLAGNSGTNPSTDFIGTNDNTDFSIRTNSFERINLNKGGFIGINTIPGGLAQLETTTSTTETAIWGTNNRNSGLSYGLKGTASGAATTNYGVYATATGAVTNWAGFFDDGDVAIKGKLAVGAGNDFGTSGYVLTSQGNSIAPIWAPTISINAVAESVLAGTTVGSGTQAVFLGASAGTANTSGNGNTFIGYRSGTANTSGSTNTFLGWEAGRYNFNGISNVVIGAGAGNGVSAGGTTMTSGNNNILIGTHADLGTDGLTNAIAIGTGAVVNANDAMVLGDIANMKVGIGISTPTARLHVNSSTSQPAVSVDHSGVGNGVSSTTTGTGGAGFFTINNGSNPVAALATITNGTGAALLASQTNNGIAIDIASGTLKYSVAIVNATGTISVRAGVYDITVNGGGTFSLPTAAVSGETCLVYVSGTGGSYTIEGVTISTGVIRQFVKINTTWRIVN